MNGIIHNCTHKDSDSPTFRMTEDKMFIAIFNYIEHLFSKIKPKQLFFMAIDGVAPRAKMNQQRARRFRTALDAEKAREKAVKEGIEMPKEEPFDSNCITPGTEFMARLTQHLKYFVNRKVSEDADWQGVEIVLSGHEVPGEGEHKIMEYIRQAKSQPDYDPNRRHCLYGLDADLIMLGLLSHDPHFCLLREEVTFGRQSKVKSKELEHQNFYLMHLCIVREYLELEFQELKEPGALDFAFDMERVIDDFILMAFFIGNDFLPHLPHLHINEGALALMFGIYKSVLPKAGGYLNERGQINLDRLAMLLGELSHVEYRFFELENADQSWFKDKQMQGREDVMERTKRRGQLTITSQQKEIFKGIKEYVNNRPYHGEGEPYNLPTSLPARDRKFVQDLADDLHLQWKTIEDEQGNRYLQLSVSSSSGRDAEDDDDDDEEEDEEAQLAIARVLKRYEKAKVEDVSVEEAHEAMEKRYEEKFQQWKDKYYKDKFGWGLENMEELRKLTENYVEGLQWVLYYYYRGVVSWPWFFASHYSPMISGKFFFSHILCPQIDFVVDVKHGLKANMDFKLGQPFHPYQQLMGVLPDRSKSIVPTAYWDLMTNPNSPIIDFYPREFELDMNGKKMDWEAVVKIPFIDESRLLPAMASKDHLLSEDEVRRNEFGVSLKFVYQPELDFVYPSSLPGIFPDLEHCRCIENIFELPTMEGREVYVGLVKGVKLGAEALAGFPSLKTLPFTGTLAFHGVNVFQQDSRNESMVATISDSEHTALTSHATKKLGKAVHVGYPFLQEAKVVRVSDELMSYSLDDGGHIQTTPHQQYELSAWQRKAGRIEQFYSKRLGIISGPVESLVHVEMLKGLVRTDKGATVKEYGLIPGQETDFATQMIVDEVISEDPRFIEREAVPMTQEFPEGTRAFFLGEMAYGRPLQVHSLVGETATVYMSVTKTKVPEFGREVVQQAERNAAWTPSYVLARQLHLNPLVLSKLTSSFRVQSGGLTLNLGLNLKFEAKGQKVLGYSRKAQSGWEYSPKATALIADYMMKFPEFIAGIIRNPKGDVYNDTDFYSPELAKEKVKEIGQWLKSLETKNLERVPLDAEQLDSDTVALILDAAEKWLEAEGQPEFKVVKNIPRNALLKPSDAEMRLGKQTFQLGDRVAYILDAGRVPIGQRGTVVGMTRTARTMLLDVVFDSSFMAGTSLNDRCKPFHGSTVQFSHVLNLTNRQVVAVSQAAAARKPTQQNTGFTGKEGGVHGMSYQAAPAPPPLRGSFRGAVAGTNASPRGRGRGAPHQASENGHQPAARQLPIHNGPPAQANGEGAASSRGAPRGRGRGRGGPTPQPNGRGYVVTDQSDPLSGVMQRNPNFKPQSYNAVPPPKTLDRGRGGRGRGGRGRGGRGGNGPPNGTPAPAA